jgi:hypothetical protein
VKEYRDEAMKRLEKVEREDTPTEPAELARANFEVNAAIANSLVDIAESLHAIRASLDRVENLR